MTDPTVGETITMTAEALAYVAPQMPQPLLRPIVATQPYEPLLLCACGHERDTHDHYRSGTDCGICGPVRCKRFRLRTGRGARSSFRRVAR